MRIFITGASGYLGARISKFFADRGDRVFALCHSAVPGDKNWVSAMEEVIVGDVRDESLMRQVAEKNVDVIIHLASLDRAQSNASPALVASINIAPTWSLLDIFSKQKLKQFVYFSTVHVYGVPDALGGEAITEDREADGDDAYALTHAISEKICGHYAKKTDVKCAILRLSNSYGAPMVPNANCWQLAVNSLCYSAFNKKTIELSADGSAMRDFIHGNDVCRAVGAIVDRPASVSEGKKADVFQVSSGVTTTMLELAGMVSGEYEKRYGEKIPVVTASGPCNDFAAFKDRKRFTISNAKLRSIGFAPEYDLATGISDLFSFLERNAKA